MYGQLDNRGGGGGVERRRAVERKTHIVRGGSANAFQLALINTINRDFLETIEWRRERWLEAEVFHLCITTQGNTRKKRKKKSAFLQTYLHNSVRICHGSGQHKSQQGRSLHNLRRFSQKKKGFTGFVQKSKDAARPRASLYMPLNPILAS